MNTKSFEEALAAYEEEQEKINRFVMPGILREIRLSHSIKGEFKLVAREHSNWDIYADTRGYLYSVAKPCSGARSSCFGRPDHLRNLIREGYGHYELTSFGKELLCL